MTAGGETKAPQLKQVRRVGGVRRWLARHPLGQYAIRRFGLYLIELWGAVTITFFFFRLIPGDPVRAFILTLEQNYVYNQQASAEVTAHYRTEFGLDGSIVEQYLRYMYKLLIDHDFGPSLINYPDPAQDVIWRALPWTIGLLGIASVLGWVFGLMAGALAGWRRGKAGADLATDLAIALGHVPYYFMALVLVFIFAYEFAWFPVRGAYDSRLEVGFDPEFLVSLITHGLLPALSIVIIAVLNWLLSTRMLMVPVLGEDYLTYAQAKGLRPTRILTRYALRNVYLPQVIGFGISLGFIFNGNVLVERLFTYPGLGNLLVNAIQQLDFNTILGITNLAIFGVLTANLILDMILPLLDPRVKYWR